MTPDQSEMLAKLVLLEEVVCELDPLLSKNAHWIGLKFLERFRNAADRLSLSCADAIAHLG